MLVIRLALTTSAIISVTLTIIPLKSEWDPAKEIQSPTHRNLHGGLGRADERGKRWSLSYESTPSGKAT